MKSYWLDSIKEENINKYDKLEENIKTDICIIGGGLTGITTAYYLSKYNDYYYYVPVTKISNENLEKAEIIINELKTTPIYHTNLISYLAASTNLTNYEILENSISLSFDNHLLAGIDDEDMLEEVKYAISLSIRDSYGIDEVIFNISE